MKKHLTLLFSKRKKTASLFSICVFALGFAPVFLFSQQSYTFTPAGATGRNGPTQTQVNLAYSATNLSGSVTINTQGIQEFTIPISGGYRVECRGAQGAGAQGGPGAVMIGDFTLTAGQVVKVLVGQMGINFGSGRNLGGGGGSYAVVGSNTIMVIAGGGGGATGLYTEPQGTTAINGQNGAFTGVTVQGFGGINGQGGGGGSCRGGGGAGWLSAGAIGGCGGYAGNGGIPFTSGGMGGIVTDPSGGAEGGFGGGGSSEGVNTAWTYAGGGGGYSGGGGASEGNTTARAGGGGSYNNGANQTNTSGINTGDGEVIITALCNINLSGISALGNNSPICAGSSATITTNAISNYNWNTGATSASLVVTPTITTSYTLTATSPSNCTASSVITITVNNTPTVTASRSSSVLCSGKSLTLTGSGATSYTWTNGTNTVPNATSFTPAATSDYTVTGGNACGTATAVTSVTVNALPNVGGSVNNPTVCNGSSVVFNGTGSANGYTWTGGVTDNVAYTPSATDSYTVTGIGANSCTNTAVVGVTVYVTPNVTPVVTPTAICLNKTATLSAVGATGYTWTAPPNTAFSNANTVTVSPSGSTTYTVTRSNSNCSSSMTVALVVNGLPTIIVGTPNPSVVCASTAASLSAVGAITYTWYPGGFQGSNVTVYPNYSSSLVNYTVVASNANCTISAVSSVSTNPNPTITINPTSTVICAGSAATLTANGASTYTWQSPVNLAQQSVTVTPLIPTLYNVTGTNIYGCTSQQSQVILVNAAPNLTASIANPGNYICAGDIGTLVATGTGPVNYSWSNGSTAPSTTVNPVSTTAYTVTGINPTTLCQSTGTVSLAVYISTFAVSGSTAICKGETATITASGAASSYTWSTNAAAPSITVSPLSNSVYYVTGITGNCSTTQSVGLTVNAIPPVTAAAIKGTICRFEPGVLSAGGATSYSWNTGANTNSITVTPTVTTTYTVTGTDDKGCSKTVNVTLFINACLGIAEVSTDVDGLLSIYPNPSNGEFTIKAEAAMNLRIVNETGQLVKSLSLKDNSSPVNVSNLANGIYFIVVEKDGTTATKKVVVNK